MSIETVTVYCDLSAPASSQNGLCGEVIAFAAEHGWVCPPEQPLSLTEFRRERNPGSGVWSPWELFHWDVCFVPPELIVSIQEEWDSLTPTPTPLNLQPDTGWVYTTVPTIAFTDDAPLIHHATLLGVPVRIRATPSGFTWTWGDGSVTRTVDAGSPYPDYSLSHTYMYREGEVDVALETTWSGDYSVNGGPWIDITGTIKTQSGPVTIDVRDPQSRLVDCDLNNNCNIGAG